MGSRMFSSLQNKGVQNIIFLDRDGVINQDSPEYIKSWAEFQFLPRSIAALKILKQNLFQIFIVTNQSAINRGMISFSGLDQIHSKMKAEIEAGGGTIQDIFFCPHIPQDHCSCRKPKPGLLFSAQKKYRLTLSNAYLVGDSAKDIECANHAGCRSAILVKTGNFIEAKQILSEKKIAPDFIAADLFDAVDWILQRPLPLETF
jgi:D-glycero-D-manno-heptose 1,7-bisphosphate phosphatase